MSERAVFDPVITAPNRLHICALLTPLEEAEFQVLRDEIGVSDSVLSKHLSQLVEHGYVALRKGPRNGRQYTWVSLTAGGRKAFSEHVETLRKVASLGG